MKKQQTCTEWTLGFSSCPNDTFLLHAMVEGLVDGGDLRWRPIIEDVETLNKRAFRGELDVTKLSFHTFMQVRDTYELLDTGAAFGFGCGPLLVAKGPFPDPSLARIAIPGVHTTAWMFLQLWNPGIRNVAPMRFDKIIPAIMAGEVDAGLLIHEGRFIYEDYGLRKIVDLGEWWETATGLPIPLGCFGIRKTPELLARKQGIEDLMRVSLDYARVRPEASRIYVRQHAQETEDSVIDAHIELYVNEFTRSLGTAGLHVIECIEERLPCLRQNARSGSSSRPHSKLQPSRISSG